MSGILSLCMRGAGAVIERESALSIVRHTWLRVRDTMTRCEGCDGERREDTDALIILRRAYYELGGKD